MFPGSKEIIFFFLLLFWRNFFFHNSRATFTVMSAILIWNRFGNYWLKLYRIIWHFFRNPTSVYFPLVNQSGHRKLLTQIQYDIFIWLPNLNDNLNQSSYYRIEKLTIFAWILKNPCLAFWRGHLSSFQAILTCYWMPKTNFQNGWLCTKYMNFWKH